jgi:HEAT repeat protein
MKRFACIAAVALGCSAPSKPPGEAGLVPLARLPEPKADLLAAYGRGGEEWERAREPALADPELAQFLVDNWIVELVRAHRAIAAGSDVERARRALERARGELARVPERSAASVVALLEVSDNVGADLAIATLEELGRPAVIHVVPLLERPRMETRRRAAAALARLPHAAQDEPQVRAGLVHSATRDPEWIVRAEASLALGSRGARDGDAEPWRAALTRALADPDAAVAEAAAEALGDLGDTRAVPVLIDAMERSARTGDPRVVQACDRALVTLTGARRSGGAAWREWWSRSARPADAAAGGPP